MNRLTITLPDDLYAMARAHAVSRKLSLSRAITDLLRQRTHAPDPGVVMMAAPRPTGFHVDPSTLLPVVPCEGRTLTMEDIQRSLDDEDVRHLEMAGLTSEEIQRAMAR